MTQYEYLSLRCMRFITRRDTATDEAVVRWASDAVALWRQLEASPPVAGQISAAGAGVNFRYNLRSLLSLKLALSDETRRRIEAARAELPSEIREGEMVFSSDFTGSHIPRWRENLASLQGKPGLSFLEVGSFEGRSCIWMLKNVLTHETARITCVDSFDFGGQLVAEPTKGDVSIADRFDSNIAASGAAHKVRKLRGSSQELLRGLPLDSFDHIYIDGSHLAPDVMEDTVLSWRLAKHGGLLTFDDYGWHDYEPKLERPTMALDAFMAIFAEQLDVVQRAYQLVLRRR